MQSYEVLDRRKDASHRIEEKIRLLVKKYAGLFTAGKFAVGGAIGFLDTEIILVLGTYLLFGRLNAPQNAFSSQAFWALNAIAFGIGVTVAFFVNEMLILRNRRGARMEFGLWTIAKRLVKFQLIFLTGNVIILIIQLLLLREVSLSPFIGNIVGAIISFPASYFFSMHFVWEKGTTKYDREHYQKKIIRPEPKTRAVMIREETEKILRRFPLPKEDYNIVVNQYKFDTFEVPENRTRIDFALKLNVVAKKAET